MLRSSFLKMPVRLNKISAIELLGSTEKIQWSQKNNRLEIFVPKSIPASEALGFRVIF